MFLYEIWMLAELIKTHNGIGLILITNNFFLNLF